MPNFEVWPTAVADRQLRDLRGEARKNAKKAMDRLERRGCEAADYHLEGDEVERFCVVDLGRDWRMIVAFPERDEVAVILVGRHIEKRPLVDVYRRLYDSLGIELPTITQRKGHPPCCPTGEPPVDRDLVDRFIAHGRQLHRRGRGRQRRR
jgi:hypothetical protein